MADGLNDYPDQWLQVKPNRHGGTGRRRHPPAAKLSEDGQLVLNHAASELLGNPDRIQLSLNPRQRQMRLTPTTPGDAGGFALSGGGNAQCRISVREVVKQYPLLMGEYTVSKGASGIRLAFKD